MTANRSSARDSPDSAPLAVLSRHRPHARSLRHHPHSRARRRTRARRTDDSSPPSMTSSRVPFAPSSPVSSSSRAPPSRRRASSPSSSPLPRRPRIRARPRVASARPIATRVETHSHSSTGTPSRRRPRSNVDAETRREERREFGVAHSRAELERASTASTRTRAKSRTGTNARIVRDMPDGRAGIARTGELGDGDDVEIVEIVRAVDDGRFEASRDVDEMGRGTRRGGTRRDDETASRGRSALEPASVKAQREALEAKMKSGGRESGTARGVKGKAREAREKKARSRGARGGRGETRTPVWQFTQWISRRAQTKRGRRRRERWIRRARGETVAGGDRETRRARTATGTDWQVSTTVRSQKKWVTKAYRELAKLLHPDKCSAPGARRRFKSSTRRTRVVCKQK